MKSVFKRGFIGMLLCLIAQTFQVTAQDVLTPEELLQLKSAYTVQLHPDGKQLLYVIYTPRTANEAPGGLHPGYMVADIASGQSQTLFSENTHASAPQWSPTGEHLAFLMKKEGTTQIFVVPVAGGDTIQVTNVPSGINSYLWSPTGKAFAFSSTTATSDKEKELKKRGYDFIFYEENLKNDNLFLVDIDAALHPTNLKQLTEDINVWDFNFDKTGDQIAFSASEQKLIDQKYMFRKIHVYDLKANKIKRILNNVGKMGNYNFSPDGQYLAYTAALNINDHGVSQVYNTNLESGETQNLTPEKYKGHISWVNWKSEQEMVYLAHEGVYPKLYTFSLKNEKRKLLLDAKESGIIFDTPLYTSDFKQFIFSGNTPADISNLYSWKVKGDLTKMTNINPELANNVFGKQEVINFTARDGLNIEGLLMKPVGYEEGQTYPLIIFVHGGPESHHSNGWLSRYATPGQVMAGKGYLVAYLNYRASTGYGVDFAMEGFQDPAGKEFDDLADGIEYLINQKGADRERVGMAGGSYGGYASAWFATYYTEYVKAVGVFVGITNIISKKGTTDIPYEELYVHSGQPLEEQWDMNLKRSPVYHAHKSKTATLIYGGAADPRIHPSQSMELYRRMKMNHHPAVRLVQYPGEGHGNRKQVGQIDVLHRQLAWMDWYVKELKPLDGPMPPLDISDQYGLDWD